MYLTSFYILVSAIWLINFIKMQIIIHQLNGRVHILSAIKLLKLLQLPHFTSFVGNKCSNLRLSTVISSYNVRRNNEKMTKLTNRMLERITVYKSNIDIVHILHTKWPAFYRRNFKITFRNGSYHFILTGHSFLFLTVRYIIAWHWSEKHIFGKYAYQISVG